MDSLDQRLLAFLKRRDYSPQDASGLARGLGLESAERPTLRALLKQWEANGTVLRLRQARYVLRKEESAALTGRVRRVTGGKLLFIPGEEACRILSLSGCGTAGLPVQRHAEEHAQDGDLVRVTVRRRMPVRRRGKRRSAPLPGEPELQVRVDEILERNPVSWVGIYRADGRYGHLEGDESAYPRELRLAEPPPPDLADGMYAAAQVLTYPEGRRLPGTARVTEVLGYPGDAGADLLRIIRKYDLQERFSPDVLAEAAALPADIPLQEAARRDDWRDRCVVTIDPASARDYDDAIALRRLPDGWELAVHIADVSHYVRPNSALDREAYRRGNSTYLPDRVLPMLPPRLSDDLCSLRAGEDRLTRLCLMRLDATGAVTHAELREAIIRSRCRLDYPTALSVLQGQGSSGLAEVDDMLREAHALSKLLYKRRCAAHALQFRFPEIRVVSDAQGHPVGVETSSGDAAHSLIEEFMLAANESVARLMREHLVPAVYRVHEEPDPAKLHEFSCTLRSYGINAGLLSTRAELCRVLEQLHGHRDEQTLAAALLRAMMRARYSSKPLGHYGLGKGDYCHFTSPIRRYADLVVHRSISRLIRGASPHPLPFPADMAKVAEHVSETERRSAAAEGEAQCLKLVEFMQMQCESDSPMVWKAVVTGAWPQGLSVEVPLLRLRGFVSGAELENSAAPAHCFYERHASCWSRTDGVRLIPGSNLQVVPVAVDHASAFIDFRPA